MHKKAFKTVVVKVGSSSLFTPKNTLDIKNLHRLASEISSLIRKENRKIILVTSGAIALGTRCLNIGRPKTIPQKQAAAAVGQSRLMRQYEKAFEKFGITTAQILLTRDAFSQRERRQNARHCFKTLLQERVLPIVNENDTVAVDEIKIGDNDTLAALTASLVGADLLVLLTDVQGFYMKTADGSLQLVREIRKITKEVEAAAGRPSSKLGTGGMYTKIQAAKICRQAKIHMVIANARQKGLLQKAVQGELIGTSFVPSSRH